MSIEISANSGPPRRSEIIRLDRRLVVGILTTKENCLLQRGPARSGGVCLRPHYRLPGLGLASESRNRQNSSVRVVRRLVAGAEVISFDLGKRDDEP